MWFPSLTLILSGIFIAYIGHSIFSLSRLFTTLECSETPCFTSYLQTEPKLQMLLFTSVTKNPISSEVSAVATLSHFDVHAEINRLVLFRVKY